MGLSKYKFFQFYRNYLKMRNGDSAYFVMWYFPIVALLTLLVLPLILTNKSLSLVDFTTTGQIGDTIGGITGPIIGFVAAYITFFAFWAQFKSNKQQTLQFKKQDLDNKLSQFENKFFELLEIHRENVAQMKISEKVLGRKCFIEMFSELDLAYHLLLDVYDEKEIKEKDLKYRNEDFMNISYILFFIGYSVYSYDVLKKLLSQYDNVFIDKYLVKTENITQMKLDENGKIVVSSVLFTYDFDHIPFTGQVMHLGHYFRHLFQTVKFIDSQQETNIDKKYYTKILRSQLSSHELLLLYYNSMSIYGQPWITKNYFKEYNLLKNIPLSYIKFGLSPKIVLGETDANNKPMFEADEISKRTIIYYSNN